MESGIDISSGDREPTRMQECKQEQEDGNEECLDSQGSQGSQGEYYPDTKPKSHL